MNEDKFYFVDGISKLYGWSKGGIEKENAKNEIFFSIDEQTKENPFKKLFEIIKNIKNEAFKRGKGITILVDHLDPLYFHQKNKSDVNDFVHYLRSMITQLPQGK